MKPYFENLTMPDARFPVKVFVTDMMEHVLRVHPHWHAEIEVLYYIDGAALQQVNDTFFEAGPGGIVVIGRDQLHSTYTSGKGNSRILCLQFDAERMLAQAPDDTTGGTRLQFARRTVYRNPIRADSPAGRNLLKCVMEINEELESAKDSHEYFVCSALHRFAGELARSGLYDVNQDREENIGSVHTMLERTFRLVDESFAEQITLEDAARASNLSPTHFCRLFKATTGMTFHDYLTFFRVNRAEGMLNSSKKLADVAFECGFGSVSSFIRNFKEYKNCTPSMFAREDRK